MSPKRQLSEFISRKGRLRLVKLLLQNDWSKSKLAGELGITRQAVHCWLSGGETHPSNSSLDRMIDLALETDATETEKILTGELLAFRKLLSSVKWGLDSKSRRRSVR